MTSVTQHRLSHSNPDCLFSVSQPPLVCCQELIVATRSVYLLPRSRPTLWAPAANTLGKMHLCFEEQSEEPTVLKINE